MPSTSPFWFGPQKPLRPLPHQIDTDYCVIGLGGSGLAAIHRLLDAGKQVVGVDARGIASGAAGRNGGFLLAGPAEFHHQARKVFGKDAAQELYVQTLRKLSRFKKETPQWVNQAGSLRLIASQEEQKDCQEHFEALREDGFQAEMRPSPFGEGLYIPTDATFAPWARAQLRAQQAMERGTQLFCATAKDISSGTIQTNQGTIKAEKIIVAVDGGLGELLPQLKPQLKDYRLQMLATKPVDSLSFPEAYYYRFGYDYFQQRPSKEILIGGGRDIGGPEEENASQEVSKKVQDYLESLLRGIFGIGPLQVSHRWSGRVSYSQDGLPILQEVLPDVFACGAYSGTGNIMGALAAEAAAEQALGLSSAFAQVLKAARNYAGETSEGLS